MHLKEIDLYGFKSFGERVKIEFNPRLTAIVGPNGSGKSNIVDSVRWLLGDQSHKGLRVPSSEEVIFKGIDNGAPFNFSHVGIVVDLAEDGEIQIERKYHRSGENEYILNGKTVRLKDIRALMSSMGFGLGSLSILSQGQIDSILSLVPTDRRIVLEEVSQISHFKENKSRILKKLDATRDNLTRLDDILREVDARITELAEQAESTKQYRKLSESQSELSIKVTFKETERLVKNIRRNLKEIKDREDELSNLKSESVNIVELIKTLDEELEQLRKELDHEMELSRTRTLEVEKLRSSMDLAGSEHESLADKRVGCLKTVKRTEIEIDRIFQQVENEKEKLTVSSKDKQDSETNLVDQLEKDKELKEEENKDLSNVDERQAQINRLRGNIEIAQSRMESLEDKLARSAEYLEEGDEAFQDKSSEQQRIDSCASELDGRIDESTTSKNSIQSKKDQAKADLDEIENSITELETEHRSQKDELIETASELRILMDLEKKLVGFHFGVKKIIEAVNKGELSGIIGPVINLLKVDSGFEKALESILGGRGQYVLVDTFKDGINALNHLKSTGGGRVTFIPLDDFKDEKVSYQTPELSKSEGYLGKALDRIQVDEKFQHVIEYLLRDALIFQDLESARDARKKHDLRQWIVTLDGDVHRPKGIFTGGSTDVRGEGPLVRRSHIENLNVRKIDIDAAALVISEKLKSAQTLQDNHLREINKLNNDFIIADEDSKDLSREKRYIEESLSNLTKEIKELRGKKDKIETEIDQITSEMSTVKDSRIEFENELDEVAKLAELDDELKEKILQDRSLREDEINSLRILISSREQEIEYINSTIINHDEQSVIHKDQLEELNRDFLHCLDLEEDAQARYSKLKYQYEMETEKIQSEESGEDKTRKQVELKRQKLIDTRERAASVSVSVEELDSRRGTQSIRIARMETELVSFLKEVAEIAGVKEEYPDLLDTESEDFNRFLESEYIDNLPARKQLVEELDIINAKIEELGEVNVLAERDYENYLRRKEFLTSQQTDLVKAADELMETLGEIEGESKKSFKEIFAQTKINFEEIFAQLFPNGNAQLSLTDPDNILDSGLEIKVKFPGKKELDLLQFSGGERSIIAIAFLFAVLKTKPPSFVILDEVEAALDDVNVEKFIRLMRGFQDKFQFIIVTHNKLTMEYARELWGVTLKKGGMSQVVNISLEDWVTEHPETVQ